MINHKFFQKKENLNDDLGLGAKITSERIMNKDGSFYMERLGDPKFRFYEIYNTLITISWPSFLFNIFIAYLLVNFAFAFIYFKVGVEHLTGVNLNDDNFHRFTLRKIFKAYGKISLQ